MANKTIDRTILEKLKTPVEPKDSKLVNPELDKVTQKIEEETLKSLDPRLRANKTNGEKIKMIIDKQVDILLTKSIKGRALSNTELQSLATCINLLKMGFEEINSSIKKSTDIKSLDTEQLKELLK